MSNVIQVAAMILSAVFALQRSDYQECPAGRKVNTFGPGPAGAPWMYAA